MHAGCDVRRAILHAVSTSESENLGGDEYAGVRKL